MACRKGRQVLQNALCNWQQQRIGTVAAAAVYVGWLYDTGYRLQGLLPFHLTLDSPAGVVI
jgi:hypothetical protein